VELRANQQMTGARLAVIIGVSVAIFAATSAVAKTDYPEWMWLFVIAGLILPWVAVIGAVGLAVHSRLNRD
jgi:hypothetical protein